jgi:hypothetical protein
MIVADDLSAFYTCEEREVEYRNYLAAQGWYRSIELSMLTPDRFLQALGEIAPRRTSDAG